MYLIDKEKCCGCTACMNICPTSAIEMKEDSEGFLYPVINKEKCIKCNACLKVCPGINKIKKYNEKKSYVVQYKDEKVLKQSTSGGAFVALAEYVLNKEGVIYGAGFDEKFNLKHMSITSREELYKIQGSKYIQSNLNTVFKDIKSELNSKKTVLFSGTPCQVSGLKKYLSKEYDNLITVDLVCRSVPSPKMWKCYLQYLEKKYNSVVNYVKFRDKTYGYHSSTLTIGFENGKIYRGSNRVCLYGKLFHGDKISRPSCYNCSFKGIDRCSDFTLFDSWNSEKLNENAVDNNKGYSNVIIHTEKGINIFREVANRTNYFDIKAEDAISYTGGMAEHSIIKPAERENIYNDLENLDFKKFSKKYNTAKIKDYVAEYSKTFLYKTGLLRKLQKMKDKKENKNG